MIVTTLQRGEKSGWDIFVEELERDEHGVISHYPLDRHKARTREAADNWVDLYASLYYIGPSGHSTMPWHA